jgi:hypothetical protein
VDLVFPNEAEVTATVDDEVEAALLPWPDRSGHAAADRRVVKRGRTGHSSPTRTALERVGACPVDASPRRRRRRFDAGFPAAWLEAV